VTQGDLLLGETSGALIDGPFRFALWRRWSERPIAAWLMCNPSTADAEDDDPTIRRVRHFSTVMGCGGAIVVNLWPLRTPYPAELWKRIDAELTVEADRRNREAIADAIGRSEVAFVAVGAEPWRRFPGTVKLALGAFQRPTVPHYVLGTTQDGAPLHPLARGKLAIPNDRRPQRWFP
jgi:hypothetical protein